MLVDPYLYSSSQADPKTQLATFAQVRAPESPVTDTPFNLLVAEREAVHELVAQSEAQLLDWTSMEDMGDDLTATYEFRSLQSRRQRHVQAHLEGHHKKIRELDMKILRIKDPKAAAAADEVKALHARKVYSLTMGCEEDEVPLSVAAMPLAAKAFDADSERCTAVALIAEDQEELSLTEQIANAEEKIAQTGSLIEQYTEWNEALVSKVEKLKRRCDLCDNDEEIVSEELEDMYTMKGELEDVREKLQASKDARIKAEETLKCLSAEVA